MILAFPMWRRGFAKVCGSVIDEALRRNHRVMLMWKPDSKPGESVDLRTLMDTWPTARIVETIAREPSCDAVIGDPSVGELTDLPAGPGYALDFVWELRMRLSVPGVRRCWTSEYQRACFTCWAKGHEPPVVGMTALDALPLVDPAIVRAKYNLGDRPILLLFALKFGGVRHVWRQTAYRWWGYQRLLHAIRAYATRHGYMLIVKTREKNHDPATLYYLADNVIEDESLWPYTSAELVKVASLVVHFQSGAVFEAAAAGVPQLSIAVPQPHLAHLAGHDVFFSTAERSLQNWLGVVQSVDYRDAPDLFREDRVWNTTINYEREEYARRFIGHLDGKSAARVLNMIEGGAR